VNSKQLFVGKTMSSVTTYSSHIGRSFIYASLATIFALLLGYPMAYVIGVKLRGYPLFQALALVLLIAPFFISFLAAHAGVEADFLG
jgi:spermidine/putrescine transport system permease protein